ASYGGIDRGPGYPGLTEAGKTRVKEFWQKGIRLFPDGYYWASSAELPEFKLFGNEWEMNPPCRIPNYNFYKTTLTGVCRKGSYADFMLWGFNQKINDGVKGLYNDGANLTACNAQCHNCGYVNSSGKRAATVSLFETRETYKRVYTLFKSRVPDSFIFAHNVPVSPLASFTDGTCEGESWSEGDYSNLLPDLFRAGFATYNQLGIPFNLYSFVSYGWRYPGGKPNVPPGELLPIALSHNLYPLVFSVGDDNTVGLSHLNPIWEIMDEWKTTSEWIPYWKSDYWVKSSNKKVKVSIYRKEKAKKALLLLTNFEKQAVKSCIEIDTAKLGVQKDKVKLTRITPAKMEIKENKSVQAAPINKETMPFLNCKINVALAARSLQFYLLEETLE
ncbi:MAG: glycoside hydrolase domain-containing protein, partial [Victivallaceae bacterium]